MTRGIVAVALAVAPSCSDEPAPPPLPLFVTHSDSGVGFRFAPGGSGRKHLVEITAGGVALLDHDGDGDLDLFFPQGAALPGAAPAADFRDRLYRNDGGWRFTDVTDASGVSDAGRGPDDYTYSAACPDFDGDGDPDLYLCNAGRNRFLRNESGRFVDATADWGGDCALWSTAAAFADYDRDGDLDLYVVNYVALSLDHPGCGPLDRGEEYRSYCHPDEFAPADDALYRNDGGRLVEVSIECGVAGLGGAGLGAVLSDYDGDDDVDLFVANDSTPNFLWRNDGGFHFTEIAAEAWVAVDASGLSTAAMGADFGDVDGDGDFDLIVANLDQEPNTLYLNDGNGAFDDRSSASGLGPPSLRFVGFGCEFADLDLDGDLDCLVANGHVCDNIELLEPAQTFRQPPHCYLNDGAGRFTQVGTAAGAYFGGRYVGRGLALGDLDQDGDHDVVVTHWNDPPALLENTTIGQQASVTPHWIGIALRGKGTNRDALGARVTVVAGGRRQVEELRGASSFGAFHDLGLRFGLGSATDAERVEVRWTDGTTVDFGPLAGGRIHRLDQP
ncbi:MAG: CRTAC1 family protein [Planctomycetes bacterium]|nr:CRTAC1 family protein [Planctomycetota bacterium]